MEDIKKLLEEKKYKRVNSILVEMNEMDIADIICNLDPEKALVLFHTLPKDLASDVFACLEIDKQQEIINSINDIELNQIMEDLSVDDAVDMIEELPANIVKRILQATSPETRNLINQYLKFPDNSAGTIMTAEYVSLRKDMNIKEALEHIRNTGVDKETIYTCYVTTPKRELLGVVTLKDLVMSKSDVLIGDIMDENVIKSTTTDDREYVATIFNKYDLLAMPVVDKENRLVGIVTVDDAVDVMEQEATEDFEKMAAMVPSEKPYLKSSVLSLSKNRIIWLLFLMVSSMFTGIILEKYEKAFSIIPLLVTFIPMITDTGGNAGSQASTLIIRGMALDEIHPKEIFQVIWKEFRVALLCGSALGIVTFIRIMILNPGNTLIAVALVITIIATVVMAKITGCILPLIAKKLHLDPAIMAAPLITTIVDATSLVVYFEIASLLLKL